MAAAEPGAIVDSSTSNRATAKRTGAFGSTGGADGAASRRGGGRAGLAVVDVGRAVGAGALPDGAADAAGAEVRRDDVDARQVRPRERDAGRQRGARDELDDRAVGLA